MVYIYILQIMKLTDITESVFMIVRPLLIIKKGLNSIAAQDASFSSSVILGNYT